MNKTQYAYSRLKIWGLIGDMITPDTCHKNQDIRDMLMETKPVIKENLTTETKMNNPNPTQKKMKCPNCGKPMTQVFDKVAKKYTGYSWHCSCMSKDTILSIL